MPRYGATSENTVPPWTRGLGKQTPPRRSATAFAARHPSAGGDFQGPARRKKSVLNCRSKIGPPRGCLSGQLCFVRYLPYCFLGSL